MSYRSLRAGGADSTIGFVTLPVETRICIVGAGPAGITAALEYKKLGYRHVVVLEKSSYIGGRCRTTERGNDLGATAWAPRYYDEVTALTDELGIEREWVPMPVTYSLESGKKVLPFTPGLLARAAGESAKYLLKHRFRWRGVSGPGIGDVSAELRQSYREFLRNEGYEAFGELMRVQTTGYGYRWDAPALYNVRYLNPTSLIGPSLSFVLPRRWGGGTGLGYWKGGTQQIWEKATVAHGLDVRTGVEITSIERRDGVQVRLAGAPEPLQFDALVLACNPRNVLSVLDASPEERRLYGRFQTYDYRTYECQVSGLGEGKRLYGSFRESLVSDAVNRPLVLFKREPDRNDVVFYVNADGSVSDDVIVDNIRADLRKLSAQLEDVSACARFEYSPHVDSAAVSDGFFADLERLQGQRNTLGVGAAYTFDILAQVIPQARDIVRRHVAGRLTRA